MGWHFVTLMGQVLRRDQLYRFRTRRVVERRNLFTAVAGLLARQGPVNLMIACMKAAYPFHQLQHSL